MAARLKRFAYDESNILNLPVDKILSSEQIEQVYKIFLYFFKRYINSDHDCKRLISISKDDLIEKIISLYITSSKVSQFIIDKANNDTSNIMWILYDRL